MVSTASTQQIKEQWLDGMYRVDKWPEAYW